MKDNKERKIAIPEVIKPNDRNLLQDVKDILGKLKSNVAVDFLRMKYNIGKRILEEEVVLPEGGKSTKIGRPMVAHETLTKLAYGLHDDYPKITHQRLSEMIQFYKEVGQDFDLWVRTQIAISGGKIRSDIRYYLLPNVVIKEKQKELLPIVKGCELGNPKYPHCCEGCKFFRK